ncbi:MAG: A/G-specific adenine glycosylase, partial [Acetatifactor sp.]|nr:A/G-specific adenine glycosylase [Acetatifactor sp.]
SEKKTADPDGKTVSLDEKTVDSDEETVSRGKEHGIRRIYMEGKGCTLEEDGVGSFPDAPSERAVKHVKELLKAREAGCEAVLLFVVQMDGVDHVVPNRRTQPEFAEVLLEARKAGVWIIARDCLVTEDTMEIRNPLPVYLSEMDQIPAPLLDWYSRGRRILPWREEPTPYHVWLSEIMLQQTRVEAVKPYYDRFLRALPDISSLAEAEEESLLKLWEGLGYYSRARNLQTAARQIMEEYGGKLPDTRERLLQLKGIGSYTAGAIASIAYGKREPAVDGNVLRVLSRLRMDGDEITDSKVKQRVEDQLREAMSPSRPGDFNQAMMEIGAMVCIPHGQPHCQECPLKELCLAHEEHCEEEYPRKAAKKKRSIEEKTVLLIQDDNCAVLRRRPPRGLLAGMYEFPMLEGYRTAEEITRYLADNGLKILRIRRLEDSRHIFSHREWHMQGYMIRVDELEPRGSSRETADWLYVEPEETRERYPIPSAFAAYVPYLNIRQGNLGS